MRLSYKKLVLTLLTAICFTKLSIAHEPFEGGVAKSSYKDNKSSHVFKDGKFEWKTDDKVLVAGTYEVHGKYLVVTDVSGPRACLDEVENEGVEVGIYEWESWDGNHYLKMVDDDCGGRQRGFLRLKIETK